MRVADIGLSRRAFLLAAVAGLMAAAQNLTRTRSQEPWKNPPQRRHGYRH